MMLPSPIICCADDAALMRAGVSPEGPPTLAGKVADAVAPPNQLNLLGPQDRAGLVPGLDAGTGRRRPPLKTRS